ncbi:MAG TPA: hypothetical protein VGL72_12420 [Bryobacteraceae bacterium]
MRIPTNGRRPGPAACTIIRMKQPDDPTLRTYTPKRVQNQPGPNSAGQSGDDMGLSHNEAAGSESVAELVEEGQYYEAEAVSGLDRPYPDDAPVRTRQVPEDDVPTEYPPRDQALDTD